MKASEIFAALTFILCGVYLGVMIAPKEKIYIADCPVIELDKQLHHGDSGSAGGGYSGGGGS